MGWLGKLGLMPVEKLLSRILCLGVICLGFALVAPTPALAQGESGLKAALRTITQLYEELEYERALAQISSARIHARTTDEDVLLSLYQGVILADMNRWEESSAAFKTALFLRPEAKLPVKVSPKVSQHFEKVRQQVKQELAASAPPPAVTSRPPATQPDPRATAPQPPKSQAGPKPVPESAAPIATAPPEGELTGRGSGRSFTRPQILIPAITGGVLLVAGSTSWALSRGELSRLNNDDPSLRTREDVRRAASRGSTFQSLGAGLLGAGVVGLGFAAGLYMGAPPSNERAVQVGTDGTSAFVQGRWP
jgi:hypothetical protein